MGKFSSSNRDVLKKTRLNRKSSGPILYYWFLGDWFFELLQQGLIVLQVTCQSMTAQDTHEDIFVVGHVGHRLDVIDMGML
jgi:hypothetical protein